MVKKFRTLAVIILSLIAPLQSAYSLVEVPTLRFALGKSFLNITAGQNGEFFQEGTPVKSSITLNPMFLWDFPGIRSRIGVDFLLDLGSPYGFVTTAGIGATVVFYPLGLSSGREKRDDNVDFVKTRFSPYLHAGLTPCKVSYAKPFVQSSDSGSVPSSDLQPYFAAIVIETELGAGVDFPITDNFVTFVGLDYRFASFTSQETSVGAVKYSGMALMLGIMTNFY